MFVKINKPWEKKIWKLIIGSMYILKLMVFYNRQSVWIKIWIIITLSITTCNRWPLGDIKIHF